jgi:hypothetical protein
MAKFDINTLLEEAPYEKSKKKVDINELLETNEPAEVDLTKPYVGYRKFRSQKATEQQQQLNPQDVTQGVKQFGQSLASLGDVLYGAVPATAGYVAQGLSSPFTTPQRAEQIGQNVSSAIDKPFGKAFGVTETPGYQNELAQKIMGGIGQAGEYTAEQLQEVSKLIGSGISPENARYMVQTGMFFLPKGMGMAGKGLKAVGTELQDVKAQLGQQFQNKQTPQPTPVQIQPTGLQSGGAAAVAHQQAVRQALAEARPDLQQQLVNRPIETFTPEDLKAIEIHNKFAKVDPEFVPTEGQATQNIAKLSDEYNQKTLEGNEPLRQKFEERDPMLIKGFNNVKEQFAPQHSGVKLQGKANNLLEEVKRNIVDVDNQNIRNAYQRLNEANNGKFPVDAKKIAQIALEKLNANDDIDFLPDTWKKRLSDYASGEKELNLNKFDNLSTQLATAIRAEKDGNIKNALGHIKDAVEELPLTDEKAIEFKDIADTARGLFRRQKDLLNPDKPTYNKLYSLAYEDNRTPAELERGNVPHPSATGLFENFFGNKKTTPADLSRAIELVGKDSAAHHEIIAGITDYLKEKSGVIDDKGNVSQAALNKELNKLGPNLDLIAGPEVANRLRNIGEVAQLSEHVRNKAGGSANVSQTGILTEGEAAKETAKNLVMGLGEAGLSYTTSGASSVVGNYLKPIFKAKQERQLLEAQKAEKAKQLEQRIKPTAGISDLGTINVKGK